MMDSPCRTACLESRGSIMNRTTMSTLALGLLVAAWFLLTAAPALADALPPPKSVTPSPIVTPAPATSAPGDVPVPKDSSGDDGHTGTLAIAGAVVVLVAGGSVVALRRASKAAADGAAADAPPTNGQSGGEEDS